MRHLGDDRRWERVLTPARVPARLSGMSCSEIAFGPRSNSQLLNLSLLWTTEGPGSKISSWTKMSKCLSCETLETETAARLAANANHSLTFIYPVTHTSGATCCTVRAQLCERKKKKAALVRKRIWFFCSVTDPLKYAWIAPLMPILRISWGISLLDCLLVNSNNNYSRQSSTALCSSQIANRRMQLRACVSTCTHEQRQESEERAALLVGSWNHFKSAHSAHTHT